MGTGANLVLVRRPHPGALLRLPASPVALGVKAGWTGRLDSANMMLACVRARVEDLVVEFYSHRCLRTLARMKQIERSKGAKNGNSRILLVGS